MRALFVAFALLAAGSYANADWPIQYLDSEDVDANLNDQVDAKITLVGDAENIGCTVRTPAGVEYDINAGEQVPGAQKLEGSDISCGVTINVLSEEQVGQWMLIANETLFGFPRGERRLSFTVHVEEQVNALPRDSTLVVEGNDFYIRLEQPTAAPETCHIEGPGADRAELDERYLDTCGYIVRNVATTDSGNWEIVYGNSIEYKAAVELTVTAATQQATGQVTTLTLIRDRSANETVGAENAVYCILENPSGVTVYERFGRCQLVLDRVTFEDAGRWTMKVGLPGRVVMDQSTLTVTVVEAEPKPTVNATVVKNNPIIDLHCSVSTPYTITTCKFRDPAGNILIASEGVGEDRYSFIGDGLTYNSITGLNTYDCGLRLSSIVASDLGLWRCAIETDVDTYYGFSSLINRFILEPEVAASVQMEPVLTADRSSVTVLEGEPTTLSCNVDAAIRYCYFRSPNGGIFSVGPGSAAANYEYAGAGFDAGECSIRVHSFSATESFNPNVQQVWSCHVGFLNETEPEQRASIAVEVKQHIVVEQHMRGTFLVVEGIVYDFRPLDYCRFVRIDGLGFTTSNLPEGYVSTSSPSSGQCSIQIPNPSILEQHPWTVVARVAGHDDEISAITSHSLEMPSPDAGTEDNDHVIYIYRRAPSAIFFVSLLLIPLIIVVVLMTCRKSREWTITRASRVRDSFRRSLSKDANVVIIDNELPKKEPLPAYSA